MKNHRYEGKPFLRLLELYVLWSINELSTEYENVLRSMEPFLQKTYNSNKNRHEIIADQMEFPTSLPNTIMQIRMENRTSNAEEFTRMFVDSNFPT